jgi:hypothetical protein
MTFTSQRPSFHFALGFVALASFPGLAAADVVTGTLTPAAAKAVIVDASGKTVAELKPGAYQLQLARGPLQGQVPGAEAA